MTYCNNLLINNLTTPKWAMVILKVDLKKSTKPHS